MSFPPPLPDLSSLSREQLIDLAHRLHSACTQIGIRADATEARIKDLADKVRRLETYRA